MKLILKKSRYLTKEECGDGIVVTIEDFREENVAPVGAKEDVRWVAYLRDHKPWVLNVTNGDLLTTQFGTDDSDGWIGKRVELFNDQSVLFNGKRGGIRVRLPGRSTPKSLPEAVVNAEADDLEEDLPW